MRLLKTLQPLLLVALLAAGCVEYNEECSRFMQEPDGVAGYLAGDANITKAVVRTDDNAIGQLVAEAYYHAFDEEQAKDRPQLSLVNSGAIRSQGVCESREVLYGGPVKRKVLRDVLPFDNRVVALSLTHKQLKNMLEHSVFKYDKAEPKGWFLQIYGGEVFFDCREPGETLDAEGMRATEGRRVTRVLVHHRSCEEDPENPDCGKSVELPLAPPSETETIRVAVDSFLQGGGDGFVDLKAVDPNASDTLSAGSFNFEIVARYFSKAYPAEAPLSATAEDRVHLHECK
ncbi:MAG TPA: hypothetical protein DFS52_25210 [Myxococcales bacterium]|jgi:2',3'-cyclic-nucleotide 2'-phosphodiesterase (5'-nucleotidase family)|nr:hypothetical protein [Myxococcales bacterium]